MTLVIAIAGINGRMGREVLAAAGDEQTVAVAAGLVRPGSEAANHAVPCVDHFSDLPPVDVVIDFTTATSTLEIATACAARRVALVSGVTGLSQSDLCELGDLAKVIPVFYSRNFSPGLAVLLETLPAITRALDGYDIEIIETHHRHKTDAPSGTALAIAEAIEGDSHYVHGRQGKAPRMPGEIGIHAVRGGGNAGEHTVLITNDGEEIRLSHRAFSRRAFAHGAIRAARFVPEQPPGLYGMSDLLGATSREPS